MWVNGDNLSERASSQRVIRGRGKPNGPLRGGGDKETCKGSSERNAFPVFRGYWKRSPSRCVGRSCLDLSRAPLTVIRPSTPRHNLPFERFSSLSIIHQATTCHHPMFRLATGQSLMPPSYVHSINLKKQTQYPPQGVHSFTSRKCTMYAISGDYQQMAQMNTRKKKKKSDTFLMGASEQEGD